jgi:hypothetical protein
MHHYFTQQHRWGGLHEARKRGHEISRSLFPFYTNFRQTSMMITSIPRHLPHRTIPAWFISHDCMTVRGFGRVGWRHVGAPGWAYGKGSRSTREGMGAEFRVGDVGVWREDGNCGG